MADKSPVKINKNHKGKEFRNRFHFVGKVKPHRTKEDGSETWEDAPYYKETLTKTNKPRRVLQFTLETAESNDLKIELAGMEQQFAYPYSSKHRISTKVAWADRDDKTKFPDETYHIINGTDWDRAKTIGDIIQTDQWAEVKGYYEFSTFQDDEGNERTSMKRFVDQFNIIENGAEISLDRTKKVTYVTDFKSPDFVEVNNMSMQIGIKNTYQKEEKADTLVRGAYLANGKTRSEPKDVELTVFYQDVAEGKPLADAFASLSQLDFIEVTGRDNNRATFTYVDVVDKLTEDDPFNEVASGDKTVRQERVVNGAKKGLEITGYVQGSIIRGFLNEEELKKSSELASDNPFDSSSAPDNISPVDVSEDPFA